MTAAAIAAAVLVLLTLAMSWSQRSRTRDPLQPPVRERWVESAPSPAQRCAIAQAHFGGPRAQLVRVRRGEVANYVVVEIGKRDPLARLQRGDWLMAAYGAAESEWLGEFGSAAAAMVRAARLCPRRARCWPGDPGCGAPTQALTPAQVFLQP